MKNIELSTEELAIIADKLDDGDSHSQVYNNLLKKLLEAQNNK